jgi:tripartite-type tricarboxylate transporter receptor subunit TctC
VKYEDVAWHSGADDYPKDLPEAAAGTHTGMFVVWALLGGLGSTLHAGSLADLRTRKVTPGAFFIGECDGKFTDEDLNAEGNAFAKAYFDAEVARYMKDYDAMLCEGLETAYHVRDTWQNFDRLKPRLDRRLAEWRAGKLGKKPWWKFWEPFVVLLAFVLVPLAVDAQTYPSRPVKIVVAFPPGGGNDFIARFVAARLSASMGQQFVVENRPGAGGTIGTELGLKAPPDGYTLTLISNSYTANASLYPLRFDPVADMTPLIQISQGPYLVVVHPSVPAKTLGELLALAKKEPERLNFASSGQGSINHLAIALFSLMGGFQLNHVPYKGTGPALTDTIGGQTNVMLGSPSTTLPHVRAGRLRMLAVTTATRIAAEPDVPTVAEAGVPGYAATLWHGLIGPKGMPASIVERINGEVTRVLQLKEAASQLQNDGVTPAGGSPESFRDAIRREIEVWRKVVRDAGIKAE